MMNAYAYAYEFAEIEGTLTITLTSTAKNGEYSEYASASAYDYAITGPTGDPPATLPRKCRGVGGVLNCS